MSRRAAAPAIGIGLFFLCVYLLTGSSDLQHNGDTVLRYETTQSIVENGHIWVAHPAWTDTRMARGTGGHLYAFYAPGQIVFMIPLYVAGRAIASILSLPVDITTLYATRSLDLLLGACLAVVFFLFARAAGYSPRVSALLTLLFGLATAVWPDAQSALEQTQVDLFLLLAVLLVWRFVQTGLRNRRLMVGCGVALGLAVFSRYDAGIYIPVVALFPAAVRLARRMPISGVALDWTAGLFGLAPWLLAVAWWDWVRFGSPFLTGLHERTFGEPFLTGLLGLTISPGKGLLGYVPLVLLMPLSVRPFVRRLPALSALLAALVVVPLLFYANILYWHGDPAWGPRYLYTAVPYLVLPLGETLTRWRSTAATWKVAFLAVALVSLGVQVEAISVTEWRYWYRLEVMQQRTVHAAQWSGQPFHWGALRYHYYWNVRQSPLLIQLDNVYQVIRLDAGDRAYLFTGRPDPYVSNPAERYPINQLAFWWADTRHPLFGDRTRWALGLLLAVGAVLSLAALWRATDGVQERERGSSRLGVAAAG